MRRILALLIFLFPASFVAQTEPVSPIESLVFTHVTVIDMTGAPPKPDMTVVIVGNHIAALGAGKIRIPKNARVIDATGQYLIPGLWDMHAHVFHYRLPLPPDEFDFPLFIANGITGVREMWTRVDKMGQIRLWRKQHYERPGTVPRFAAVGTLVDGPPATWANSDTVSTADEARLMVGKVKAGGVDFLKVYHRLSREAYFAIADEARKKHISFAGHVPFAITLREASDAGQRSVEHLTGFLPALGPGCPPALLERMAKEDLPKAIATGSGERRIIEQVLELCDERKAFALFRHLAENGTWQVPTLILRKIDASASNTVYADERLKYMPGGKDHFRDWGEFHSSRQKRTAKEWDEARGRLQRSLEVVGTMHRAGVKFMAGTDVSNPYVYPGFSLHDELALFVEAGLTPMEALQTATRNPAEFLGLSDSLGTIGRGKFADLVLLEADPLVNISNTQRINAVVVNGRYLSKGTLRKILSDAEASANSPGAFGQETPSWVSQLETLLEKQEPKWTIADKDVRSGRGDFLIVIKLKSGRLRAEVIVQILDSAEHARAQFDGEAIAFTNILEKHAVKSKLDGLGDENFLFTGKGKRKNGNVFLIQGNVIVKVFAPSAETAKRFTMYVVNLMPPSNQRLQRTGISMPIIDNLPPTQLLPWAAESPR